MLNLTIGGMAFAADGIEIPPEFPSARIVLKREDTKDSTNRVETVISRDAKDWESSTKTENSAYQTSFVGGVVQSDTSGSGARYTASGSSTNITSFASSNPLSYWPTSTTIGKTFLTATDTSGAYSSQRWINGEPFGEQIIRRQFATNAPPTASSNAWNLCRREINLTSSNTSKDGFYTTNVTGTAKSEQIPGFIVEFTGGTPGTKFLSLIAVRYTEIPSSSREPRSAVIEHRFVAKGEAQNGPRGGTRYFPVPLPFIFECQTIEIAVKTTVGGPLDELTHNDNDHNHTH